MKVRRLLLMLLLAIAAVICWGTTTSDASIVHGPVVNPVNGKTYYLLSVDSWTGSETTAQSLGGNLATVQNAAEDNWIVNTFGSYVVSPAYIWIGLLDPVENDGSEIQHEQDFRWIDGEPVTYEPWGAGEPDNNSPIGEYYTGIAVSSLNGLSPGVWNDLSNIGSGSNVYGLVETPEPASMALLGMALLLSRRRPEQSYRVTYASTY